MKGQSTHLQTKRTTVFNQQLIYRKIQHMLDSQSDLGAGGKISTSTVFYTIIHITLLKYFKSLVTCDSLFKQTPKKEDPSICFRSATLENFTPEHRSAVVSDFECHSPFALFHKKLNCNNNRRVSPKKQKNSNNNNNNNNNDKNNDSNNNIILL